MDELTKAKKIVVPWVLEDQDDDTFVQDLFKAFRIMCIHYRIIPVLETLMHL